METLNDPLVPSWLVPQLEAAAREERRDPSELVRDAVERYLAERCRFRRDDVHAKIAKGLKSLEQGKSLDGEVVIAELLSELDNLSAR